MKHKENKIKQKFKSEVDNTGSKSGGVLPLNAVFVMPSQLKQILSG